MLHYEKQSELGELFPNYTPRKSEYGLAVSVGDYPSSLYLQVVGV